MCPSPNSSCRAVTHLRCLAEDFLGSQSAESASGDVSRVLVPRGGSCRSCHEYILWGDIIRGCYRRQRGGVVQPEEAEEADEEGEDETEASALSEELESVTNEEMHEKQSAKSKLKRKKRKAVTSTQDKVTAKPKINPAKRTRKTNTISPAVSPPTTTKRRGRPRKADRAIHTLATDNVGADLAFKWLLITDRIRGPTHPKGNFSISTQ